MARIKAITVTLEDGTTETLSAAGEPARPGYEVYADQVKAAMDQFRFFGQLRALVTWFPIVLVLTGVEYTRQLADDERGPQLVSLGLMCVGLLLVWLAQRGLEKRQYWSLKTANEAEQRHFRGETRLETYRVLYTRAQLDYRRPKWDPPSRYLFVLFIILAGVYGAAVLGLGGTLADAWTQRGAETGSP